MSDFAVGLKASRFWTLGLALAVATWPLTTVSPFSVGLDPSWAAMLHYAAVHGMNHGDEISYTYGPLGFLAIPKLFYPITGALAFGFTLLVRTVLATMLLKAVRLSFGWAWAITLAGLILGLTADVTDAMALIIVFGVVAAIDGRCSPSSGRWVIPLAGLFTTLSLQTKFNIGLFAVVLLPIGVWFVSPYRWKSERWYWLSVGVSFPLLWLATGGNILNIPWWIHDSLQFASGYSDGGLFNDPVRDWELTAFAGIVVFSGAMLHHIAGRWERRQQVALVAALGFFVFSYFKHGFVRHDVFHSPSTFLILAALPLTLVWVGRQRFLVLAVVFGAVWVTVAAGGTTLRDTFLPPLADAGRFVDQAVAMVTPASRSRTVATAKQDMRELLAPDPVTLALIEGRPVHVEPHETSLVWLYDLRWRPAPIFQSYAAHTAALDTRNARLLMSSRAPERILRHWLPTRINNRLPEGDSPAYTMALVCNYREARATPDWQVLERQAARCGPERKIGSIAARNGDIITLPPRSTPTSLTYIRVATGRRPWRAKLRSVLYKPKRSPLVVLDEDPARVFTVFLRDAANPLLLRGPVKSNWSSRFSGPSADTQRVRFESFDAPFRVDFFERSLRP